MASQKPSDFGVRARAVMERLKLEHRSDLLLIKSVIKNKNR
jgi:hypothetical protein